MNGDPILIPRTFHRIWLGREPLPTVYAEYGDTWLRHNQGWELRLWTDENLPDLERAEVLDQSRIAAERADILRYELLWRFGGVYVDTDFECLRPIEALIAGLDFFTAYLKRGTSKTPARVNNALIGSVPGHPILRRAMTEAKTAEDPSEYSKDAAGPLFFDRIVGDFPEARVFDAPYFYPVNTRERKAAYADHHAGRSWASRDPAERAERNLEVARRQVRQAQDRLDKARQELASTKQELSWMKATRWWRLREALLRRLPRRSGEERPPARNARAE
jgi:mannosyltransferase OCH1-like enzyme